MSFSCAVVMAAGFVASSPTVAHATKFWKNTVATGNWNNGNNWSAVSAAGADVGGVPVGNEDVNIVNADAVGHTVTYDVNAPTVRLVTVNHTGAGAQVNTLSIPNNNNLTAQALFLGGWTGGVSGSATTGRGAVNQSAGTVTMSAGSDLVVAHGAGSTGAYTLSGTGALVATQSEFIGYSGTGVFNQNGGINTINASAVGSLSIGSNAGSTGTYNLSSGQLTSNESEYVGVSGIGVFDQTGGNNTIVGTENDLFLGYNASGSGTYTISGGTLTIPDDLFIGNSGGGTMTIGGSANVHVGDFIGINTGDSLTINNGTLRLNTIAVDGTLDYFAGTIRLPGARNIGGEITIFEFFNAGSVYTIGPSKALYLESPSVNHVISTTLNVNDGDFTSISGMTISGSSPAALNITNAGTASTSGGVFLGDANNGSALVDGVGSTWTIASTLFVGVGAGTGTLTIQNGGFVSVGTLSFTTGGTVNLNGGTLRMGTYDKSGTAVFNFNTGTIELTGNRTLGTDPAVLDLFGASIAVGKGLTVLGTATVSSPLTLNGGTLRAASLNVNAPFLFSSGVLELTGGTISGLTSLAVPTAGEFRASGVQPLRVTGAPGSVITATGSLTLGNASAVNGFGTQGTLQVGANTVALLDANDVVFDSLSLVTLGSGASFGTVNAVNGLTLDFGGNVTGYGTVFTPNNIAKPLINNGHIIGNSAAQRITLPGYVKGVGTFDQVNFTGTYSPGLSPATAVVGSLSFTPTSTLLMELGGTAPGSGYDQLQASGSLTLGGALQVSLINGFIPSAGQSFNILDWGSLAGTFSSLNLPTLSGLSWNTSQLYSTGVLSVASAPGLPGDFNNDGTVNAADYVVWRKNPGGIYTQADFNIWRANFSNTAGSGATGGAPSGSSAPAVPEPASLGLLFVALLTSSVRRQKEAGHGNHGIIVGAKCATDESQGLAPVEAKESK
jgi:T5SS/PEP-CTERM-associated repeat protein